MRTLLSNNFYDRDIYPSIGISFKIEQRSYSMVEHGEFWTISLIENTTGQAVFTPRKYVALTSRYDFDQVCIYPLGDNDFIQFDDPRRYCFWSTMPTGYRQWAAPAVNWSLPCEDTGNYTASVVHSQGVYKSEFILSDFVPGEPVITGITDITPKTQNYPAGKMDIEVTIKDNKGCNKPLAGIEVQLLNTIIAGSGGHNHDLNGEPHHGTGQYISTTPVKETSSVSNTNIIVKTDSNGAIKASYQAGIYGLDESLKVTASRPATTTAPERKSLKETQYSIKIPGLVALPTDGSTGLIITGTGGICDSAHNPSRGIDYGNRYSIYLTAYAANKVHQLNALWQRYDGNTSLNFNDASLPNGGFFDRNSLLITEAQISDATRCHNSHREGTGIDVNHDGLFGSINIGSADNPVYLSKEDVLLRMVISLGGVKLREPSIHYEFKLQGMNMKSNLMICLTAAFISLFANTTFAEDEPDWGEIDPNTLKDPRARNEDISHTKVTVKWEMLADGKYAYTYTVQSLAENKGRILTLSVDVSCNNPSLEPTGYAELESFSDNGKHIELGTDEAVTHPLLAANITAHNEISWLLSQSPGETRTVQRIISKEAPVLRAYELYPAWGSLEWNYKPEYFDEPTYSLLPGPEDFIIEGTILGPRCTTDTSPIPENPDTTPEPTPTPANCPKGNAYGLDIGKGHETSKGKHTGHSHDCP